MTNKELESVITNVQKSQEEMQDAIRRLSGQLRGSLESINKLSEDLLSVKTDVARFRRDFEALTSAGSGTGFSRG